MTAYPRSTDDFHGTCAICGSPAGIYVPGDKNCQCADCLQASAVQARACEHLRELVTPALHAFLDGWAANRSLGADAGEMAGLLTQELNSIALGVLSQRRRRR